jgi:hypothetical protein
LDQPPLVAQFNGGFSMLNCDGFAQKGLNFRYSTVRPGSNWRLFSGRSILHQFVLSVLFVVPFAASLSLAQQPQLSKEYIYLDDRLVATSQGSNTDPILISGGIANWWSGDSDGGDLVGTSDGTILGTTIVAGKVGNAFSFDGVDDYVDIPTINVGGAFSVELWIYPTKYGYYQNLVSYSSNTSTNYGSLLFDGSYRRFAFQQANQYKITTGYYTFPSLNAWVHVALTHDGYYTRIYVNGVLQGTSSGSYPMNFDNPIRLGYSVNGTNTYFGGLMDEVSIYNRALSEEEIVAIYNAGSLGKAKYQFNINTTSLPTMYVDNPATYQIATTFGASPISFVLASGTLPSGMELGSDGVISGTPTIEGEYSFTVRATDANGLIAERIIAANVLTALIPPSGLVSWWPGDGNADDIAGSNNGALVNGTSYYNPGKVAGAFWLDGTNDYVDIPTVNMGDAFSVELWIYPTKAGYYQNLVSYSSSTSTNYGSLLFDGSYKRFAFQQANQYKITTGYSTFPSLNTWLHVALTHDGYYTRIYVNGVLQGTSSGSYPMNFDNPIRLGYSVNGTNSYFGGLIDEVSVYDRALSLEEIQSIFDADSRGKSKQ